MPADLSLAFPGWTRTDLDDLTGDDLWHWSEQANRLARIRQKTAENQ